jgi:hypothetical protein
VCRFATPAQFVAGCCLFVIVSASETFLPMDVFKSPAAGASASRASLLSKGLIKVTDAVANLTHEYLKRIDAKLDRVLEEMHEVKVRLTSLEENGAVTSRRLDRIDGRLDRIEKRLDLVEA